MRNPGITRHMKDLERLKTIQAAVDRELKPGRAAERLGLSVRSRTACPILFMTSSARSITETSSRTSAWGAMLQVAQLVQAKRDRVGRT